jgi:hypothetical protein
MEMTKVNASVKNSVIIIYNSFNYYFCINILIQYVYIFL